MRVWCGLALAGLCVVAAWSPGQAQSALPRFTVVDLGPMSGYAIDAQGDVVGSFVAPNTPYTHAALYQDQGGMVDLFQQGVHLDGNNSAAYGVSVQQGQRRVVGSAQIANGETHAFGDGLGGSTPGMTDLNGLQTFNGGHYSITQNVNAGGEAVGTGQKADSSMHAFKFEPAGTMIDLGTLGGQDSAAWGINNHSEVCGTATATNGFSYATVWSSQIQGGMSGIVQGGEALAINDNRLVVGRNATGVGSNVGAFAYDLNTSTFKQLPGTANSPDVEAHAVNNKGWIVGLDATSLIASKAVMWLGTTGSEIDLNTRLSTSGWKLIYALGVNDAGQICGIGIHNGAGHGFRLDPPKTPPTITGAKLSATNLPVTSSFLTISATVTSGSPVTAVSAQITGSEAVTLGMVASAGSDTYTATTLIPANTTGKTKKFKVKILATNAFQKNASANAGTAKQAAH